jgi:hypothetical protein
MDFARSEVSRVREMEWETVARDVRVVCSKMVDQLVGEIVAALDQAQKEQG